MEKASFIDRVGADNFCANIDVALTRVASFRKVIECFHYSSNVSMFGKNQISFSST